MKWDEKCNGYNFQVQFSFYSHTFLLLSSSALFPWNMLPSIWETGEKSYLKNKSIANTKSWFSHVLKDAWLAYVIHLSICLGKHQILLLRLSIMWYFMSFSNYIQKGKVYEHAWEISAYPQLVIMSWRTFLNESTIISCNISMMRIFL